MDNHELASYDYDPADRGSESDEPDVAPAPRFNVWDDTPCLVFWGLIATVLGLLVWGFISLVAG